MRKATATTKKKICNPPEGPPSPDGPVNQVVLDGILVEPPVLRATPNGRSVVSLEVEHDTLDPRSGQRTAVHITVIALDQLAEYGRTLPVGASVRVVGSLDQRRWIREGKTRWGRMELLARQLLQLPERIGNGAGSQVTVIAADEPAAIQEHTVLGG